MPDQKVMRDHPASTFRNRTLVFVPIQGIRTRSERPGREIPDLVASGESSASPECVDTAISRMFRRELEKSIHATRILYVESVDFGEDDFEVYEANLRENGTVDSIPDTLSLLRQASLESKKFPSDLSLVFNSMSVSVEYRGTQEQIRIRGTYMIWDYFLRKPVVQGRISAYSNGHLLFLPVTRRSIENAVELAVYHMLYSTPFMKP